MDKIINIPKESYDKLCQAKKLLEKNLDIKTTEKTLLSFAIDLLLKSPQERIQNILSSTKMDRKEAMNKFFANTERYDFGDNWLEEIDTTL